MDLYAYAQIDSLEEIMVKNGIKIPRLRGLRLMRDEIPLSKEQIQDEINYVGLFNCENLCRAKFRMHASCFEFSDRTDRIAKKYLIFDENRNVIGINWDNAHGKIRKLFKYELRQAAKRVNKTYGIFNNYCGRDDVLYIHARIGGHNWDYYGGDELRKQSWFLEKVDDAFDNTYCDIYAKIGERYDSICIETE